MLSTDTPERRAERVELYRENTDREVAVTWLLSIEFGKTIAPEQVLEVLTEQVAELREAEKGLHRDITDRPAVKSAAESTDKQVAVAFLGALSLLETFSSLISTEEYLELVTTFIGDIRDGEHVS